MAKTDVGPEIELVIRSLGSRKADVIRTEFVGENNKKQNISITCSFFFIFKTGAKVIFRDPPRQRLPLPYGIIVNNLVTIIRTNHILLANKQLMITTI